MKHKIMIGIYLVILLLTLGSCSGGETASEAVSEPMTGGVELLSGYPKDILPLYNSIKVEITAFSVRADSNWVFGKDIYTVSYYSSAAVDEVHDYYWELMDEIDEDYSGPDMIQGRIGSHPVGVTVYDNGSSTTTVDLIVGQDPADYVTENPYFTDYPGDLVEPFGRERFFESSYEVRDISGPEIIYTESYVTNTTEEKFKEFYSEKYSGAEHFYEDDHDYGLTYQWDSRGYVCRASISAYDGGGDQWVTTIVSKPL